MTEGDEVSMQRLLSLPLALSLLALAACRGPDLHDAEAAHQLVAEAVSLTNERADTFCACADEFGFSSMEECHEYFTYVDPAEHDCLDEVVDEDAEAAREYLECTVVAGEELAECLEPWTCGDGGLADRCHAAYGEALGECPEMPVGMIGGFRACVG